MLSPLRRAAVVLLIAIVPWAFAAPPPALREVNPKKLSGGLFSALDAEGAFGSLPPPARALAGARDLSKGHPPIVLDARVGPNIRLGDDPAALPATQRGQAEPHIARSVFNPQLLLATSQEGRFAANGGALSIGYSVSTDGGFTWSRGLLPQLTQTSGGPYFRATDPVAVAGVEGNLYVASLASLDNAFGRAAVVVSRSTDKGVSWSAPVVVFQSPNTQTMPDKDWLVANDFVGSPNAGRMVATWTNFTSNAAGNATGNNLVASVSDDRGLTWSGPINITAPGANDQATLPVFLPDGSLAVIYVSFFNAAATQFSILCKRSINGGVTYPATPSTVVPFVNGWDDPQMRTGVFIASAAVARTTGDLFVCYTAANTGSPRIFVTKSTDRGTTWSAPVVVSDQPAGVSVANPAIAVTPNGTTVSVVFMDKRNAPDGANFFDLYAAQSFDAGATWQANMRLTEMSSDIRYATPTSEGYMVGDYLGVAPALSANQPCVAVWCDTRTGDSDPFTAAFTPSATESISEWLVARGIQLSSATQDRDQDGLMDVVEYRIGTDPLRADFGEDLVLRLANPTTLEIAWAERPTVSGFTGHIIVSSTPPLKPGFGLTPVATELPTDRLPTVPAPPGLVWRGVSQTIVPGTALGVSHGVRFTAGQGPALGSPVATVNTDSRLINLSTRGQVLSGPSQLIGSLVTHGAARTLLVRGVGPTLTQFVPNLNVAADPALRFVSLDTGAAVENDDWSTTGSLTRMLIINTGAQVGVFPLGNDKEAALGGTFAAGSYSAQLSNRATTGGNIGLVEIYDASTTADGQLVNLSTRGEVGAGDAALIAGFVLKGTQPRRVLIRAVGPSLARFNVGGALLADPVLTLYRGATQLGQNDDWQISPSSGAIAATGERVGAFALDPASLDAALLITLDPGAYTAVVTSADGGTGIALVEIYDAD